MCKWRFIALFALLGTSPLWAEDGPNPDLAYFVDGQTPDSWQWVLSDPGNWWLPVPDSGGRSGGGKVTLDNAGSDTFPNAIRLRWRSSNNWGGATITGREVDISAYEHSAELVIALKVEGRVPRDLAVKMTCGGEQCEASVNVGNHLRQMPRGEWMLLPIPLNCFSAQGLDLSKVTSPFGIGTATRLELHIAEIRLAPMAEDNKGCVTD